MPLEGQGLAGQTIVGAVIGRVPIFTSKFMGNTFTRARKDATIIEPRFEMIEGGVTDGPVLEIGSSALKVGSVDVGSEPMYKSFASFWLPLMDCTFRISWPRQKKC